MPNAHVEGRSTGAALRPLSPAQIKHLVLMARQAFGYLCDQGELGDSAEFDVWRHQQCLQCVERSGLSSCRNEDYLPMLAHFLRLLGRTAEADEALARHVTEPRSHAMAALEKACKEATQVMPYAMEYAAGFVRNKLGVAIEDADDKTLWAASYMIARRAAQLRRKGMIA